MIKSYDYILGNGKFINLFDIITGVIICSAISFCLTETLFSFNFKLSFQKVLIFTILFLLLLLLFYYFIKQRRYKLLDDKIVFGFRKKEILYRNINSLVFTLTYRPKGQYDIGLGEPYLYVKEHGTKKYICNITICLVKPNISLDAKWGDGKTFFVRQIEEVLKYVLANQRADEENPIEKIPSYEYLKDNGAVLCKSDGKCKEFDCGAI